MQSWSRYISSARSVGARRPFRRTFDKYNPPHESTRCQYAEKMPDGTIKWKPIKEPAERPKKFLAYNYRYSNCGGYSFFYDVDRQILYANWSSN